jgi:2-polyprenyl-3-methyl-5-hydroxy-6-metoxy-1,4-benzoquinol methylase
MLLSDAVKPLFAGTELRYPQFLPQCPVCTATASKELFVLRGFSHRQCRGCGFIFVNPRLSDEGARIYYNSEYYRQYCDNNERPINEVFGPYCRTFGPGLPDFVERLRTLCPRGRVVDVGCGLGALLASLPATDFERVGVEYNEAAARFAREHFGLRIVPDLADLRGAGTGFDLVTAIEVIEHVADPLACMQDLAQMLRPTGVLVVTTPNIGGLDYHLHGRQCAHFCAPSHVNFFTVETLTRLAGLLVPRRCGELRPLVAHAPRRRRFLEPGSPHAQFGKSRLSPPPWRPGHPAGAAVPEPPDNRGRGQGAALGLPARPGEPPAEQPFLPDADDPGVPPGRGLMPVMWSCSLFGPRYTQRHAIGSHCHPEPLS